MSVPVSITATMTPEPVACGPRLRARRRPSAGRVRVVEAPQVRIAGVVRGIDLEQVVGLGDLHVRVVGEGVGDSLGGALPGIRSASMPSPGTTRSVVRPCWASDGVAAVAALAPGCPGDQHAAVDEGRAEPASAPGPRPRRGPAGRARGRRRPGQHRDGGSESSGTGSRRGRGGDGAGATARPLVLMRRRRRDRPLPPPSTCAPRGFPSRPGTCPGRRVDLDTVHHLRRVLTGLRVPSLPPDGERSPDRRPARAGP